MSHATPGTTTTGRILRVLRTVRHLRISQVGYQLWRRLGLPMPRTPRPTAVESRSRASIRFGPVVCPPVGGHEVSFLNVPGPMNPGRVDWTAPDKPKLWRYNLHYFDYLHWPGWSDDHKAALIDDWIRSNPAGTPDAWEPYPVSLRVVNWIKYFLRPGAGDIPRAWLDSLAGQIAWLSRNVEYHLLANHLFKNGKALLFGGLYFDGPEAGRWLRQGRRILAREVDEQILPDGGHFERSPMYHCITLEDCLDVVNLARSNPGLVPDDLARIVEAGAERALGFLARIVAGDGRIPLFNDSAFGIAPEPADLIAYGKRVLGRTTVPGEEGGRICLPDTGYFGYRQGGDSLIVDCGPVGPDYQPGHAHCDTLSYELCVDGRRVIVDTGVFSYEADAFRHAIRATAAHNTVRVDGAEQSEIWGAFRVARRARPLAPVPGHLEGGQIEFRGAHDGYRRLPGGVVHERRIVAELAGRWTVFDLITARPGHRHRAENFVHVNSELSVERTGQDEFLLRYPGGGAVFRLTVTCGSAARIVDGYYCPEFGRREPCRVIVLEKEGPAPLEMRYTIERT